MSIGICELCGKKAVWVNTLSIGPGSTVQACDECFDKELPAKPIQSGGRSDPAFRTDKEYHGDYYRG